MGVENITPSPDRWTGFKILTIPGTREIPFGFRYDETDNRLEVLRPQVQTEEIGTHKLRVMVNETTGHRIFIGAYGRQVEITGNNQIKNSLSPEEGIITVDENGQRISHKASFDGKTISTLIPEEGTWDFVYDKKPSQQVYRGVDIDKVVRTVENNRKAFGLSQEQIDLMRTPEDYLPYYILFMNKPF